MKTWRTTGSVGSTLLPSTRVVDRHIAPAEHPLTALDESALDRCLRLGAGRRVLGQEDHADPVAPRRREFEVHHGAQEGIRDLHQDAGPVAGPRVGAGGAAVGQPLQQFQPLPDDGMALLILDMADEPDAAGVMLVRWVIETLCGRKGTQAHR